MIRFDLPDDAGEEEIEEYLASLHDSAREKVRELIQAGASADEINAYLEDLPTQLEAEEQAELEEEESR